MKKAVAIVLSAVLMTSSVFASFPDVSDTFWGKDVITKWTDLEIVKGDNVGNFRPNDNITRAEFSVILNKLMKYNKATENQFKDVKVSDWFYEDIGALAQAGVMAGTEGNALPKQNITRQDAVVLMAKAFNIEPTNRDYGFSDGKDISSYAKGYVNAMAKLGYIQGRENNAFCPKVNLTRTEALAIADKLVAKLVNKEGTYTENIEGNMLINTADVSLKDAKIKGNLYIAEGVGDGEIYINNTKIEGDLIVEGGGNNSIYIVDSYVQGKLHLNKRDGKVRVKASGETNIEKAVIANGATLDTAEVTGEGIKNVELSESLINENTVKLVGEFKTVESKAENVVVEVEGKIETVKLEKPATIEGDVEIANTEVAEGVEANIKGEVVSSKTETKVEEKEEEKEESSSSGGGGSSGGISGGSSSGGSSSGGSSSNEKEEEITGYSFAVITFNWKPDESQDGKYHFMLEDLFAGKPIEYITASLEGITSTSGKTIDVLKDGDIIAYASTVNNKFEKIILVDSAKNEIFPGYSIVLGEGVLLVDANNIKKNDKIINLKDTVKVWYQNESLGITEVASGKESIIDEEKTIIDSEGEYVIYSTKDTNEAKAVIINNKEDLIEKYQLGMVKEVIGEETLDGKKALKLNIINKDGTTKTYTLVGNEGDYQISKIPTLGEVITAFEEGMIVSFVSDEEFNILDTEMVALTNLAEENTEISGKGYYYDVVKPSVFEEYNIVDYGNKTIYGKDYTQESVVFNKAGNLEDEFEVVKSGFEAIVNKDDETIINDEDEFVVSSCFGDILCVVVDGDELYYTNRFEYGYVKEVNMVRDVYEVVIYTNREDYTYRTTSENLAFAEGDFIKYKITDEGKLDTEATKKIVDVESIVDLDKEGDITNSVVFNELILTSITSDGEVTATFPKAMTIVSEVTESEIIFNEIDGERVENIQFETEAGVFSGLIYDLSKPRVPEMREGIIELEGEAVLAIDLTKNNKADIFLILSDYFDELMNYKIGFIDSVINPEANINGNKAVELSIFDEDGKNFVYWVTGNDADVDMAKVETTSGEAINAFSEKAVIAYKADEENIIKDEEIIVINSAKENFLGNCSVITGEGAKVGKAPAGNYEGHISLGGVSVTGTAARLICSKDDNYEMFWHGEEVAEAIIEKNETIFDSSDEYMIYYNNNSYEGPLAKVIIVTDNNYFVKDESFGVVKSVAGEETDGNGNKVLKIRILNTSGETKLYTVYGQDDPYDESDSNDYSMEKVEGESTEFKEGMLLWFRADEEDRILDSDIKIMGENNYGFYYKVLEGDNVISVDYENEEINTLGYSYYFTEDSVIFNIAGTMEDETEVIYDFRAIVDKKNNTILNQEDEYIVYDVHNNIICVLLDGNEEYYTNRPDYAFVVDAELYKDDTWKVSLYNNGQELSYETNGVDLEFNKGDFIKYKVTNSGKLNVVESKSIIKVEDISALATNVDLTEKIVIDELLLNRTAVAYDLTKKHITVDEHTSTSVKFDEVDGEAIVNIKFERNDDLFSGIIYDLRDVEEPKMITTITDITGKAVFAIDLDENNKADIFVMVKR